MEKKIKVIEKVMKIIETIANSRDGYTCKEISKILNLKITTIHSLVSTFHTLGYFEKDEKTKKYKISDKFLKIFYPLIQRNILLKTAEPVMKSLAEEIKESVVLVIFYKGERYTIAEASFQNHLLNVNLNIFRKGSFYETATGRVLLAYLNEKDLKDFVKRNGYPGQIWKNIETLEEMKKQLEKIRKKKIEILIIRKETVAIGVPIFDSEGKVCASLGVYLPIIRFKGENRKKIIKELKKASEYITLKMGGKSE